MRITDVEIVVVRVPLIGAFKTSHNMRHALDSVVVRVSDSDGRKGYGSIDPAPGYMDETVADVCQTIRKQLVDVVIGQLPVDRGPIWHALHEAAPNAYCACAAVELAVWDLYGRQSGLSLCSQLGGVYRQGIPLIGWIGLVTPEEAAEKAKNWVSQGFTGIKLKVGTGGAEDIDRLKAVRSALGPGIHVRVDANEHFTVDEAARFLEQAQEYGLNLCEQPLPRGQWRELASLRRSFSVPIMVDEGIYTCDDVLELYEAGAADAIKFKVMKHGGIHGTSQMMAFAASLGFKCTIGHGFSLAPVAMAEAALAASFASPFLPAEMVGPLKLKADIVDETFPLNRGNLVVGSGAGLGVTVSEHALEQFCVA